MTTTPAPRLGIVIPTLNEEGHLPRLIADLGELRISRLVVVADGGSRDRTVQRAREAGALVVHSPAGRGTQLRAGAGALDTPWLLFLHADTRLPLQACRVLERWLDNADPEAAAHFRFGLDGRSPHHRFIEMGQKLREWSTGLAFGDQGLVVSRSRLDSVGGVPDLPLMEDVELIRRLRRSGPVHRLDAVLPTSPRRYEGPGGFLAPARNALLLGLFLAGVPAARLTAWYRPEGGEGTPAREPTPDGSEPTLVREPTLARQPTPTREPTRIREPTPARAPGTAREPGTVWEPTPVPDPTPATEPTPPRELSSPREPMPAQPPLEPAPQGQQPRLGEHGGQDAPGTRDTVLVFARAPVPGRVKTRLAAGVGHVEATRIYRRLGRRVVDQIRSDEYRVMICHEPPDGGDMVRDWLGTADLDYQPQHSGDLGVRMAAAIGSALAGGAPAACVVGTDAPEVDRALVREAFLSLHGGADVVLGPALDGGYYLVGLREPHPELFAGIPWSTDRVLDTSLERCTSLGLRVVLLPPLRDVDTVDDLKALFPGDTVPEPAVARPPS